QPEFHLARRLTTHHGSFSGVIRATIDISELEKFYKSIDVGPGGAISLFGFDNIVRAHTSQDPAAKSFLGRSAPKAKVFALYRQTPAGVYWNYDNAQPQLEKVKRLVSYRVVAGFPLLAVVGLAEDDIFQQARATAYRYCLIALLFTVCV